MREPGFYWVLRTKWEVFEWDVDEGCWVKGDFYYHDAEFDEIDERRIVREFPGLVETSLGEWAKNNNDTYDKLLNEIKEAVENEDDFMEKIIEDDGLKELISKAIMMKAVQLATNKDNA
jgi:hypothetical protein